MKRKNKLILEFTEFNLQRFGAESAGGTGVPMVDNPQLSLDAFDKHQSGIRQAMSRIDDILYNLKGTSAYSSLRSKLALEDQDIQSIKILRIVKSNSVNGYLVSMRYLFLIYHTNSSEPTFSLTQISACCKSFFSL